MDFLKEDPNLVWLKDCLVFDEKIEIGLDLKTHTKKYVQVDIMPCQEDCLLYTSDADYEDRIAEFLNEFSILARMLDSKSDFKDYYQPFQLRQSLAQYSIFNPEYDSKTKMIFKQVVVQTLDGFFFRSKKKDLSLTFKGADQNQKTRLLADGSFGSITFELDRSVLIIERIYPTFIDMISKFGGLSRVISFFIFSFISLHHLVVMERYLLNEAILQKHKELAHEERLSLP